MSLEIVVVSVAVVRELNVLKLLVAIVAIVRITVKRSCELIFVAIAIVTTSSIRNNIAL